MNSRRLIAPPTLGRRIVAGQTGRLEVVRFALPMSALGQKQTLRKLRLMSALPPKADIADAMSNVRFVAIADISSDMISIKLCRNIRESAHANFAWKTWQGPEWPKSKGS